MQSIVSNIRGGILFLQLDVHACAAELMCWNMVVNTDLAEIGIAKTCVFTFLKLFECQKSIAIASSSHHGLNFELSQKYDMKHNRQL